MLSWCGTTAIILRTHRSAGKLERAGRARQIVADLTASKLAGEKIQRVWTTAPGDNIPSAE